MEFMYLYLAHGKGNGIELINSQLTTNKNELKGSSLISKFINLTNGKLTLNSFNLTYHTATERNPLGFISISDTTTTAKPSGKL